MTDRDENDFLSRWSRRKVEARRGLRKKEGDAPPAAAERPGGGEPILARETEAKPVAAEGDAARETAGEDQPIDESEFADVDFDKLDFNSDYTRFMKKGVPAAIRQRALRKLWTSDPVLACVDGLNDYDLDYTDAATVVKDLTTSWKIGRGFQTDEDLGIGKAAEAEATEEGTPPEGGAEASDAAEPGEPTADAGRQAGDTASSGPDDHDKS